MDSFGQQLKRELVMFGIGSFFRWSLAVGWIIVSLDEKSLTKPMHTYLVLTYLHIYTPISPHTPTHPL